MYNISCINSDGEDITSLTQWDLNQTLILTGLELQLDEPPVIYFNSKMLAKNESVSVTSSLDGENVIVDVPNFLLQQAYPITIFVSKVNRNSSTIIASTILPVKARNKPSEYTYVENITSMTLLVIDTEIKELDDKKADKIYVDNQDKKISQKIDDEKNNLVEEINKKADQLYVDRALSGTPRAVFSDAFELIGKDAGMYLNQTNGYIYYWDGENISPPIVLYQAVQIEKKSITEDMFSDELRIKALEDERTFYSEDDLNVYINSGNAKAGQIVKVLDSENQYQVYILQTINSNLEIKKINSDEEVLNTMVAADLDWNEATRELQLLNRMGEPIGNSKIISAGLSDIDMEIETDPDDEEKIYLVLVDSNQNPLSKVQLPAMGGNGNGNYTTMRLRNGLQSTSFTIPYNEETGCQCEIKYTFTSIDSDGIETGLGTASYEINGNVVLTQQNLPQGETVIDLGEYLTVGKTNTVRVIVVDSEGTKKAITYSVTVSQNYITSTFATVSKQSGSFSISYTPVGSGEKTVHFLVDGIEIDNKIITASNRVQYQTIPALPHGDHKLQIYMTTILEGYADEVISNTLTFGIVSIEDGNVTPIILVMDIEKDIMQYSNLSIPFIVYDPQNARCNVNCFVDDTFVTSLNVTSELHSWNYRLMLDGEHTFSINYNDIVKTITVNASKVDVAQAETSGLKFYFNPSNRSNNEENPDIYEYINEDKQTYHVTFNNMNFSNDGWTGESLNIGVGSSIDIDCKPFVNDVTDTSGKTIEFYFKAKNVYNYDSLIISCFANDRGIHITPNNGSLNINSEDSVNIQYKDEEEIKISFVISNRNSIDGGKYQLIYVYVNSCIAGIIRYSSNDNFSQLNADGIHIGSDEAAIELYTIRYYEVALSSYQILDNYIADAPNPIDMLERNARNDIFDENNEVDYDKLPSNCPYLWISCPELPQYKGDKKTGIYGFFIDKLHPEKSFRFTDAEIDVQGTSSAGYYIKNFKIKFKGGFILFNIDENETVTDYSIYDDDIPVATFCYKADVASSEGANNVVLMKLWDETVPYQTPPQLVDSRVRYCINSRPIVLFWENTLNGEVSFRGKYNFNNDKSTANTFGFVDDELHNCQCWEFKDNGLELTEFRGDDFDSLNENGDAVWTDAFEARFPENFTDTTKLRRVVSWVASTNTKAATNNALSEPITYEGVQYNNDTVEYRLAKFKNEFEDYFVKVPTLYYYFFTLLFLMTDSRGKNQFITTWDGTHWLFLPYDGDTALGIDNVGALKFGYWLEDTDTYNGNDVFNAQKSVLHENIRLVFSDEVAEIAQQVISQGKLNFEYVSNKFIEHQSAWSEAIFCADTIVKYINAYLITGDENYLAMAQGDKAAQRLYWLYYRFLYICSKYNIGISKSKFITLRMSEPQGSTSSIVPLDMTVKVTPYGHTYIPYSFGQTQQIKRAYPNEILTVTSTLDRPSDSPVYFYNALMIKSLGDLSAAYVRYFDASAAENLEEIILGNPTVGYENAALTSLGIGNNKKLRLIDVRNCTNLSGNLAAGSCNQIEKIYADGTKITSVSLPIGGTLKVLHLPETISSLMIKKQQNIEDFYIPNYNNLTSLYLDDCPTIDVMDILNSASKLTNVYLANINWDLNNTDLLDKLLVLGGKSEDGQVNTQQSVLTGIVHVPSINTEKYNAYTKAWSGLTITYDTFIEQYPVTFKNDDGTVLGVEYIDRGQKPYDPIEAGLFNIPIKASTIDTDFTFDGWDTFLDVAIINPIVITATYTESPRQYTVKFVSDGTVLQESVVDAHSNVLYEGLLPTKTGLESSYIWYMFNGWDSVAEDVLSDLVINAIFVECVLPAKVSDVTQYDYIYTDDETCTSAYTLPQLYAICKSDRYNEYLAVGDEIKILIPSHDTIVADTSIIFQVYGFNHFQIAGQTEGNMAHVVFGMKGLLTSGRRLNPTNTNAGGWAATEMRTWLNTVMITYLPSVLQNMIIDVEVLSSKGQQSSEIVTSTDKLFLFSHAELGWDTGAIPYRDEVSAYAETVSFALFTDSTSRIKKTYNGEGSAYSWWLRSPEPSNSTTFRGVNGYGGASYNSASGGYCVAFGFCI